MKSRNASQLLGHTSLKTTARYLHLTNCGQQDAAAKINAVMAGAAVIPVVTADGSSGR